MEKLKLSLLFILFSITLVAQDGEDRQGGFKKENLFTGGSVTASFFNQQTLLGANPIFGYKIANWVDAGIAFNFIYNGARDYLYYDDKIRQTTYGPGAFVRVYPVRFLFAQAQYEYNFSNLKYIPPGGSPVQRYEANASSLLVGAGLAQGRMPGGTGFYYISLLFDVLKNINSPYVNVSYNPNDPSQQRIDMTPILRAGFNIPLFQKKYRDEDPR